MTAGDHDQKIRAVKRVSLHYSDFWRSLSRIHAASRTIPLPKIVTFGVELRKSGKAAGWSQTDEFREFRGEELHQYFGRCPEPQTQMASEGESKETNSGRGDPWQRFGMRDTIGQRRLPLVSPCPILCQFHQSPLIRRFRSLKVMRDQRDKSQPRQ